MRFRRHAVIAAAIAAVTLGACAAPQNASNIPTVSGSDAAQPTSPGGTAVAKPPKSRKSGTVTATITFQDAATQSSTLIAGQPIEITITLTPSTTQTFGSPFIYDLPINTANTSWLTIAQPIATTCTGLTANTIVEAGKAGVSIMPAGNGLLTTTCTVTIFAQVSGEGTIGGTYGPGTVVWTGSGTLLQTSPNPVTGQSETISSSLQHLYVPVQSPVNQGSVNVYQSTSTTPIFTCTISSTKIPNPIAVAVDAGYGWIYVLDKSGLVAMFAPIGERTTCPTNPIHTWNAASNSTSLAVDSNSNIVVSSCSAATWYSWSGTVTGTYGAGGPSECFQDVASNYFEDHLDIEEVGVGSVYEMHVPLGTPPTTACTIGADLMDTQEVNLGMSSTKFWHIAAGPLSSPTTTSFLISVADGDQQFGIHLETDGFIGVYDDNCAEQSPVSAPSVPPSFVYPTAVAYDPYHNVAAIGVGPNPSLKQTLPTYSPYIRLMNMSQFTSLGSTTPGGTGYVVTGIAYGP